MNIELQAKLLRALETSEFYKVGDSKPTKVNVRFIAASNRNLEKESEKGTFRADLFYRLSVFSITLPSLSERLEDIEILAAYFIKIFADKMNKPQPKMSPAFLEALKHHAWKGNTRELKNVTERAVILTEDILQPEDLPFNFSDSISSQFVFDIAEVEKQHIQRVLKHTNGNKTEAAKLMNIGLTTLYRKLQDYKIE